MEEPVSVERPATVGELLVGAFVVARSTHPELGQTWTTLSWRIGGLLPRSMLMATVQRLGEIDAVCRAVEREMVALPPAEGVMDFRDHYYTMLAELWIGTAYSICYILKTRKLVTGEAFETIANHLRIVRVQLEKYELSSDRALQEPLAMAPAKTQGDEPEPSIYLYDKNDSQRAHIGRRGVSARRSLMWEVIDVKAQQSGWLERLELSERFLSVFGDLQRPAAG
jgi:hypothetical protein